MTSAKDFDRLVAAQKTIDDLLAALREIAEGTGGGAREMRQIALAALDKAKR